MLILTFNPIICFVILLSGLLRRFAPRNDGHRERSEAIQSL